jgi:hypothetical protein
MHDGKPPDRSCWLGYRLIDASSLANFYIPVLSASVHYYGRSAGFFSSSALVVAAAGVARVKGKFVRPEAEASENMRLAFFNELVPPVEKDAAMPGYVQMGLEEAQEDLGDDVDG